MNSLNAAVETIWGYNTPKWRQLDWIRDQLQKHVIEITSLQKVADPHTLAELTDYEIILGLAQKAGMPLSEILDWHINVPHQFDGDQDVNESNRYTIRLAKIISKIYL